MGLGWIFFAMRQKLRKVPGKSFFIARGARGLHLHHRLHSAGLHPDLALAGWRVAARGELTGFIFTIDCTPLASDWHLALAGCWVAARALSKHKTQKLKL